MKKKILCGISLFIMIVLLCSCGGKTFGVNKIIDESEIYTESEIESAIDVVVKHFRSNFSGCTLTEIKYDEELSDRESSEWAEQYDADQAIVLVSSFDVDPSGGDGSFVPNETYSDWKWILVRSGQEYWQLKTWGYG